MCRTRHPRNIRNKRHDIFLKFHFSQRMLNPFRLPALARAISNWNAEHASSATNAVQRPAYLDHVTDRFMNLNRQNYTPNSALTYKSRLRSALEDFKRYVENPMSFRPSVQSRAGAVRGKASRSTTELSGNAKATPSASGTLGVLPAPVVTKDLLPIPIRADLTVYVQGLPFDLTLAEARKIGAVIAAMAAVEDKKV
jgi:hypothetical protein